MKELTDGASGAWNVVCTDGAVHIVDLEHFRYYRCSGTGSRFSTDESSLELIAVDQCSMGEPARFTLRTDHYLHYRQTARVQSIEAYTGDPLPDPARESAAEAQARWTEFRSGTWLPDLA